MTDLLLDVAKFFALIAITSAGFIAADALLDRRAARKQDRAS